eukprot:TRINITY_DN4516_c0_g2_i1.p1 TRINITY_DN4516_c0_g2~~TRINITY_DN4516_c0_g2_i1.p1  ORF type:complete len:313 (+),score=27.95 TRINITY_DN4516_c0_g2_i1:59-997(+)
MDGSNNMVIKNTFINVIEDDNGVNLASRPRLKSDPTSQLCLTQSAVLDGTESRIAEANTSTSSPRTFVPEFEYEMASTSSQEWSSRDSPFCNSSVSERLDSSTARVRQNTIPMEWQGKTSVMVRNISYKCTRGMLGDELKRVGFGDLFDYLYVPVNTARNTSKGYAFINFLDASSAYRFKELFHGRRMDLPGGTKLLEVIPANLQGYNKNVSHYIDKQNELSAAAKPFLVNERSNESGRRTLVNPAIKPANCMDGTPQPESSQTIAVCHRCQNHVLSKSRFCQWCGAELQICSVASRPSFGTSGSRMGGMQC